MANRNSKILIIVGSMMLLGIVFAQFAFAYPANINAPDINGQGSNQPERLVVAANGTVYVSEPANDRIRILSSTGTSIGEIAIHQPVALGVLPNGDLLVGHDTQVDRLNANGVFISSLGNGVGEFEKPNDMVVASNGSIYVTDSKAHQVKIYGNNGSRIGAFGGAGSGNGQFMFPAGICMNVSETEVYVVDQGNARVQMFNRNGSYLRQSGRFTYQNANNEWVFNGTFTRPQGIAVDQLNRIYISDLYQSDLQMLDAQGEYLGRIVSDDAQHNLFVLPMDIAMVGNRLYAISSLTSQIYSFTVNDIVLSVSNSDPVAKEFKLNGNYPNPFNASTRIRFTLSQNQNVKLTIWNAMGQQVATLVEGNLSAGQHEYTWNSEKSSTGAAASGVYFCKLTATGNGTATELTKKMLLVK